MHDCQTICYQTHQPMPIFMQCHNQTAQNCTILYDSVRFCTIGQGDAFPNFPIWMGSFGKYGKRDGQRCPMFHGSKGQNETKQDIARSGGCRRGFGGKRLGSGVTPCLPHLPECSLDIPREGGAIHEGGVAQALSQGRAKLGQAGQIGREG